MQACTHCNLKSSAGACLIGFDLTDGNIGQHACSSGGVVFPTRGQRGGRSSGKLGTWPPIGSWERTADAAGRRSGLWEKSALCKSAVSYLKGWLDGGDLRAGNRCLCECSRSLQLSPLESLYLLSSAVSFPVSLAFRSPSLAQEKGAIKRFRAPRRSLGVPPHLASDFKCEK